MYYFSCVYYLVFIWLRSYFSFLKSHHLICSGSSGQPGHLTLSSPYCTVFSHPIYTEQKYKCNMQGSCGSGGHSGSRHANCTLPQLVSSLALCCVTQLLILEWLFIVPSTRWTCVMIMLFNQLLDMPHLSGGWIILTEMLTNRDVNTFVHNIWEK